MKNHSSEDIVEQECASVMSEKKEDIERKSTMKHVKIWRNDFINKGIEENENKRDIRTLINETRKTWMMFES